MGKKIFLFPGQASQYIGMTKDLCNEFSVARQTMEEANDALSMDLSNLCFSGDIQELTKTENAQPAILAASVASYRVYMEEIGQPADFAAGHSLGEISALVCAGAMNYTEALKLVRQRGRYMQEAVALGDGAMAAVTNMEIADVEKLCLDLSSPGNTVVISNYNSPKQVVISGHKKAVQQAEEALLKIGAHVTYLKVSAPFHSPLMKPAAEKLQKDLRSMTFDNMTMTIISNAFAQPYKGPEEITDLLTRQITYPVQWEASIRYLKARGVDFAFEMGPGAVLNRLMKNIEPAITVYPFGLPEEVRQVKGEMAVSANPMTLISRSLGMAVSTQNHNWDEEAYKAGVVTPYKQIEAIQQKFEQSETAPQKEDLEEVLRLLVVIMETKQTSPAEQKERIEQILEESGLTEIFPHADDLIQNKVLS
ncbi:ACP S-malonyltransferase [Viridibacillus sp. YIM B01967]|uniref:[acyl-carrier-protein] S-malonyltransferase n=1 Tax=Viridibacillus soli TaxID=2798301 RepID=A0ABS1H5S6_9BACL|nr:ACP S-malonyltransferase [Viridibacillus soli]MBK3494741.1 ACP S-malonyltransferase [Viridibacillus soli]